jgi:uncharacterized protein DUF6600
MKKKLVIIGLALAMLFGIGYKSQAQDYTTVSFNMFFDALAPYGSWISMPDYGYAWQPTDVGRDWRPYTNGQWVWTDDGWTWVSYEPAGWATYHYGRWMFTDDYGWVWIPGTTWAPAWVTWYTGPDYIGWAPLPPDNNFFLEVGTGPIGFSYNARPSYCVFVPSNSFLYSNINSVAVPLSQNVTIIRNTTNINNITVVNNRVINNGPSVGIVERATGVKVQKVNIVDRNIDTHEVVKNGVNVNKLERNNLYVFRPNVVKRANETPRLLKREPVKRGQINQPSVYKEEELGRPSEKQGLEKQPALKGGEINQPPTEEKIKPSKQQELKEKLPAKAGETIQPPTYREEFGKPSKQQGFEKKPALKGGETNEPTVKEKNKAIKPSQQTEQKKKEEKQKEEQ